MKIARRTASSGLNAPLVAYQFAHNICILLLQVDVFDVVDAVYTTVFVYIDFETETEVIQSMNSFIYTNKYHLYILFIVMFI